MNRNYQKQYSQEASSPSPKLNLTPQEQQAEQFKAQGNACYVSHNYVQACQLYSKSIQICPENPVYYLNRAKCFKQLGNFESQIEDAKQALNFDETYVKAFLTLGEGWIELAKKDSDNALQFVEKGLQFIKKAKSLCAGQVKMAQFEGEINDQLLKARKISFFLERETEDMQEAQIMSQLLVGLQDQNGHVNESNMKMFQNIQKIVHQRGKAQRQAQLIIPDHLQCPITLDIMKDPVMLISGHTYEKGPIMSHLKNHNSDPLTGQQLGTKHFVENVGIRKACEDFLQANPWAHNYMPGVDYRKIKM